MRTTMSSALTASAARLLTLFGLPRLPELPPLDPAKHRAYEEFTSRYVDPPGSPAPLRQPPHDMSTYLRWLGTRRQVLFHGSQREDLSELGPGRESSDSTEFGNQRAVFASDDPIWAMWFALLIRGPGFRSTRNGVWSVRGSRNHRQYFFSVDSDQPDADVLAHGWMYVLPRDGFTAEAPFAGLLQSGQWVNPNPVRPLARIAVTPADFPFAALVGRHSSAESMIRTLWRARTAYRRR
jgi:hypothetical protein